MDDINAKYDEKIKELIKLLEESNKKNIELTEVMTNLSSVCQFILDSRKKPKSEYTF